MPRARNKEQLLDFGRKEFERLTTLVSKLTDEQRDKESVYDNRTAKDLVAHIYAWQLMEMNWYKEGMSGKMPQIPAPGYTFKDAPKLNEKLFQEYKLTKWNDLEVKFKESHKDLLDIINKHTDDELTAKNKYAWTGSTNMASYFASALSSHYVWAIDLIRKHFRIKI